MARATIISVIVVPVLAFVAVLGYSMTHPDFDPDPTDPARYDQVPFVNDTSERVEFLDCRTPSDCFDVGSIDPHATKVYGVPWGGDSLLYGFRSPDGSTRWLRIKLPCRSPGTYDVSAATADPSFVQPRTDHCK